MTKNDIMQKLGQMYPFIIHLDNSRWIVCAENCVQAYEECIREIEKHGDRIYELYRQQEGDNHDGYWRDEYVFINGPVDKIQDMIEEIRAQKRGLYAESPSIQIAKNIDDEKVKSWCDILSSEADTRVISAASGEIKKSYTIKKVYPPLDLYEAVGYINIVFVTENYIRD